MVAPPMHRTNHQRDFNIQRLLLGLFISNMIEITRSDVFTVIGPQNLVEPTGVRHERNVDSSAMMDAEFVPQPDLAPVNVNTKRRQYVPIAPVLSPALPPPPPPPPAAGVCPGGPSLPIECDPKRPWPQCPPQSYCYATNSVDIGPYFCCPVWSTYGAAWRPATPFYNYAPPPPPNWPPVLRSAIAHWPASAVGLPPMHRARRPARLAAESTPAPEELKRMIGAMNDWVAREQKEHDEITASGTEPEEKV
ncbi:unnamed protein product [Bursaphelenchus xylophilus]|uniref:(pine wood nematode) hypothetical protein n=1 Tax=Bursaphelenchus xylophilus TaxID=6326 RepID=A0A1I7SW11_BURXY|nr:unnamed protein product [Bursaphelenchus xylophilus]CAG9098635.1 unnamed protein product [Bursaphelenchus xylophilus]